MQDGNGQNQDLGGTVRFADFLNLNAETGAISIAEYDDQAVWNKVMFKDAQFVLEVNVTDGGGLGSACAAPLRVKVVTMNAAPTLRRSTNRPRESRVRGPPPFRRDRIRASS